MSEKKDLPPGVTVHKSKWESEPMGFYSGSTAAVVRKTLAIVNGNAVEKVSFNDNTRTGRFRSDHPNHSNPPKPNNTCVGCDAIRKDGGGTWLDGEPHYVGCPTELEALRSEIQRLQHLLSVVG